MAAPRAPTLAGAIRATAAANFGDRNRHRLESRIDIHQALIGTAPPPPPPTQELEKVVNVQGMMYLFRLLPCLVLATCRYQELGRGLGRDGKTDGCACLTLLAAAVMVTHGEWTLEWGPIFA